MKRNYQPRFSGIATTVCGFIGLVAIGCSNSPNAPVNAAKARETLQTALESWKSGEPATALESRTPPIYIIDQEWKSARSW